MADDIGAGPTLTAGERLREWRAQQGMGQKPFGRVIGVSQPMISDIESGRTKPSRSLAERIFGRTGIPVDAWQLGQSRPAAHRAKYAASAAAQPPPSPPAPAASPEDRERLLTEARELLATEPSEGLAQLLALALGCLELAKRKTDVKSALAAVKLCADLTGYTRSFDAGDSPTTSPAERVDRALRDPLHGPLLREAVLAELARKGDQSGAMH